MIKNGYIALSVVLIVGFVITLITITTSLTSISEGQFALAHHQREITNSFVDACAEDALVKLNADNALPNTIFLPGGTCPVTTNSQVGTSWDFTVTGTVNNLAKSIRIQVNRGTTITVSSWQEL